MDLNVPYEENDAAKALGAKWDPTRKTWYAPEGDDINKFARWAPKIAAWNAAADGRGNSARSGKHPRNYRRQTQGRKRGIGAGMEHDGKVSFIPGHAMTGKHYVPSMCPDCATTLPWEAQCAACTAAYEGRGAVARAEAGAVATNRQSATEVRS